MNRGRAGGGGVGSQKNPKEDQSGRWLTGRIQCAKSYQTNLCTDTPSPQTNRGEEGRGRLHTDEDQKTK